MRERKKKKKKKNAEPYTSCILELSKEISLRVGFK